MVSLGNILQLKTMRHERREIQTAMLNHVHHSAHPFLAAGAQSRPNRMIAKPIGKRLDRQLNIVAIDAKAGQCATGF